MKKQVIRQTAADFGRRLEILGCVGIQDTARRRAPSWPFGGGADRPE